MEAQITQMWASPTVLHLRLCCTFRTSTRAQMVSTSIPIEMIEPECLEMLTKWWSDQAEDQAGPALF